MQHQQRSQQLSLGPPAQQHLQPSPTLHIRVPKIATLLKSEKSSRNVCGREGVKRSKGSRNFRKDTFPPLPNGLKTPELSACRWERSIDHRHQICRVCSAAVAGTCRAFSFTDFQSGATKILLCSLQLTCKPQPGTSETSEQLNRQSAKKYIAKTLQMGTGSLKNKGNAC